MPDNGFDGTPALIGAVTGIAILDPDNTPNLVLPADQDFSVNVSWTVTPPATAQLLDGRWELRAYAESMGPGPELQIGNAFVAATGATAYAGTIGVAKGQLAADDGANSGVYKLVVVLLYPTVNGTLTTVAGYTEGPVFLIRTP